MSFSSTEEHTITYSIVLSGFPIIFCSLQVASARTFQQEYRVGSGDPPVASKAGKKKRNLQITSITVLNILMIYSPIYSSILMSGPSGMDVTINYPVFWRIFVFLHSSFIFMALIE